MKLSKNRYIPLAKRKFWSVAATGCHSSAHVAHVPARPQATWAELWQPAWVTDQKLDRGVLVYPIQVTFFQIFKKIGDIVVPPSMQYITSLVSCVGVGHFSSPLGCLYLMIFIDSLNPVETH